MASDSMFLSAERSTAILARTVCELRDGGISPELSERARSILLDLLGVTVAGARTNELQALSATWRLEEGKTRSLGSRIETTIFAAAELDAIAACCLELDEGNKYAAGHPAAHVVPAAIAAVRMSSTPVDGHTFLAAVVAGYEVAARFGHALTRDSRWHTHGHWGATGAAAAAASIWGADVDRVAAAIDASAALIHVSPWGVVLEGNFARNLWIAGAVRAGLDGARLSEAALVDNSGALTHTLGDIVGTLDYSRLTEDLGTRWFTMEGYAKQHSSCSYTHAAIDTVQSLRAHAPWNAEDVEHVRVRTHSLAVPLFQRHPTTRLGAMFSLPFAVAAAFVTDRIDTEALDPTGPVFTIAEEFSNRVHVTAATELDELLPRRRAAEVTVVLRSGEEISALTPNPIGDVDHFPMDYAAIEDKIAQLIGEEDTAALAAVVSSIADTTDVAGLFERLP